MRVYEASLSYNIVELGDCITINNPSRAVEYLRSGFSIHPTQESFWVIMLDSKSHALGRVMVSLGTATSCLVHPREVFRPAILASATQIIVAHNHPSGDPSPSQADLAVTRQLREASMAVDIALRDHIVVGTPECDPAGLGWYSFRSGGML